jgi:hypothetical protein
MACIKVQMDGYLYNERGVPAKTPGEFGSVAWREEERDDSSILKRCAMGSSIISLWTRHLVCGRLCSKARY